MPAKKATALKEAAPPKEKEKRQHGLTKSEACKVLQIAPTADEELITQAYWHQARKVRVLASRDPAARKQLDELNRAFLVMNPARTEAPLHDEVPPPPGPSPLTEEVVASVRRLVEQTKARWPNHVPEVTTLIVTTSLLTYLALSAGATPLWTLITAGAAAVAIWAPWRRL